MQSIAFHQYHSNISPQREAELQLHPIHWDKFKVHRDQLHDSWEFVQTQIVERYQPLLANCADEAELDFMNRKLRVILGSAEIKYTKCEETHFNNHWTDNKEITNQIELQTINDVQAQYRNFQENSMSATIQMYCSATCRII